ncbi:hypothetical protein B0H19DRAFT_1274143 [Mycena capillaripes]|nr:hypothetical protein B0H19DRAFT_1274143 [Mycena capillaripes]
MDVSDLLLDFTPSPCDHQHRSPLFASFPAPSNYSRRSQFLPAVHHQHDAPPAICVTKTAAVFPRPPWLPLRPATIFHAVPPSPTMHPDPSQHVARHCQRAPPPFLHTFKVFGALQPAIHDACT